MAYKQLGLVELITSIQKRVKSGTGLECYDAVELNAASPFYFAQVVGKTSCTYKNNVERCIYCLDSCHCREG